MPANTQQAELFGVLWWAEPYQFRLRVNDIIRYNGNIARIIRVTESAAIVLMNRPVREFKTRFDRPVRFRPSPITFHISPNSETEILNRKPVLRAKTHRTAKTKFIPITISQRINHGRPLHYLR